MADYNGWKNYQTWNVALWIGNDEGIYFSAKDFMSSYKGKAPYAAFVKWADLNGEKTPDGIKWNGSRLDYRALNEMMREL